ncbi:MAG TPA: MFS transporter [Acidobacteriaceae bacterium]|nr:MFS transporter [Acidobacteriaceae bacterium]
MRVRSPQSGRFAVPVARKHPEDDPAAIPAGFRGSGIGASPDAESVQPAGMSAHAWVVVALLVFSVVVNYVDRSDLSIAAPLMQKQFALTPVQLGSLLAAFFWTYALMQISGIAGWLSDRFPAGWVILCGYVMWSLATVATGLTAGFVTLFALRLLLGVGESVAYPCYSRIFAQLPQQYRGRANAFIDAGTKLGPAAGAFVGGMLVVHFGWRMLFVVLGLGGLLWVPPWWKLMPRTGAAAQPEQAAPAESIFRVLRLRSAWGTFLGHFCGNYFFYFLLAWLPEFLVREEHLSIGSMSRLTTAVFLLIAVSTLVAGWTSDRLIARGVSPTRVRKTVVVGGLALASVLMALAVVPRSNAAVGLTLLAVACVGYGAFASNHWAITQTLAGPTMAGRWSSLQNGFANFSGIAAPWIAGWIAQANGSSRVAFVVAGGVALAGALSWGLLVRRVEPVPWNAAPAAPRVS